jgi:hypothetical protein
VNGGRVDVCSGSDCTDVVYSRRRDKLVSSIIKVIKPIIEDYKEPPEMLDIRLAAVGLILAKFRIHAHRL